MLATWQYAAWREDILAERVKFIENEISKLKKEVDEIKEIGEMKAMYGAYVRTADGVRERKVMPAAEALAELSRLPQKVVLQQVTVRMNRLTAIGEAASESDLAQVLPALQGARFITKPRLAESPSSAGKRGFRLEAEISSPASAPSPDKGTRQ